MRTLGWRGWSVASVVACLAVSCGKDARPTASAGHDLTPKGLGKVCTSDQDCANDLTC